jgi:hypothetical protein
VLTSRGYPSKANRAWLRERRIAATIPECDDQIAQRKLARNYRAAICLPATLI